MHSAPSVTYPVGRSRFAAALLLGLWLAAATAGTLWWLESPSTWRLALMATALAASGAVAARGWAIAPGGAIAWDGQAWSWSGEPEGRAPDLLVGLDLQRWLLLRWTAGGSSHWLWLSRASRAERWDDLRRAVYSRARPQEPQQARPPAAKT
jgi:toxin CptA